MDVILNWGFYLPEGFCPIVIDLNANPEYYKKLKELLFVKKVKNHKLIRVGARKDGGYIMLDDFETPSIAYSFGICDDVSWDNSMASKYDYQIFMYDHTIDALPYTREEFHFFKEGIAGKNSKDSPLKTLEHYIKKNNHTSKENMILKMDVEGAEWEFIETVDPKILEQFDQIIFEFHSLTRAGADKRILSLLEKLNETHSVIHVHGNNTSCLLQIGDTLFPDAMEVTYANKQKYEFEDYDELFLPIVLDVQCDFCRPEVGLGEWNKPLIIK